jgi:predicted ATP-dependent serine protease
MAEKTVLLEPKRSSAAHRGGLQVQSARELVKREWSILASKTYSDIVLGPGALVAIYGSPGQGKSTFALRYADGLPGAIVFFSAEEKLGPTMTEKLSRLSIKRADFHVVAQGSIDAVAGLCRDVKAQALVIDSISVSTLQPQELRPLLESSGVQALVWTQQATKDGRAAGANAYLHESDVVLLIREKQWHLEKSRYQQLRSGSVEYSL